MTGIGDHNKDNSPLLKKGAGLGSSGSPPSYKFQSLLHTGVKQFMNSSDEQGKAVKAHHTMLSEQYGIPKSYLEKILKVMNNDNSNEKRRSQTNETAQNSNNTSPGLGIIHHHHGSKSYNKHFNKNGSRE